MLITVCGEDTIASRNYVNTLKQQYKSKEYEIKNIPSKEVLEVIKSGANSLSLFEQKRVFFIEGFNTYISRIKDKNVLKGIEEISTNKDIEIVNWEEGKSSRDIKTKLLGTVKEFKPDKSIFSLLDTCYPGNLQTFIQVLNQVTETQDEGFAYAMLCKHIRTLILAGSDAVPSSVPSWQKYKLIGQAKKWDLEKLTSFYDGLAKIDVSLKTSNNIYGIKKSLELLACYYL